MNWPGHFVLGLTLLGALAYTRPLGTLPVIEQGESRIELEMLSDLWASPYQRKDTPMRVAQGALKIPFVNTDTLKTSFGIDGESRSLGIPGLVIGNNQVRVGPELRSETIGLAMGKTNEDASSYSLFLSRESASDETFHHHRDMWTSAAGFYRTTPIDGWNWTFGFHRSANRGIWNRQTIPIFGFNYHVNPTLKITAGFPYLALDWDDLNRWTATVNITNVGILGRAAYQVEPGLMIIIRAGLTNRSYAHVNRINDERRLIYEEKKFDIGTKIRLTEYISYGLLVGYSYDRKLFEGDSVFAPIGDVRTDDPDFFGGFRMEYIF